MERRVIPVWLLDVDGVLNARRPGWGSRPLQANVLNGSEVFRIRWAPALVGQLFQFHRTGAAELRWATTWAGWIGQVEEAIRLPSFPLAVSDLGDRPQADVREAKLRAALHVVEHERRPLIWTDDDAIPGPGPELERLEASGQPLLLIAPDPRTGLQPEHLRAAAEFLARCGAGDDHDVPGQ